MNEKAELARQQAKQGVFPFQLIEQWDDPNGGDPNDDRFFVFLLPASLSEEETLAEIKQAIREDRDRDPSEDTDLTNEDIESLTWDDLADDGWLVTEINLIRREESQ